MGTVTINTTAPQDARIVAAFGKRIGTLDGNNEPRDATASEVKAELIDLIRKIVANYERDEANAAAAAAITDLTITP